MVRPGDLGPDLRRGLGLRRSLAEDYLFEQPVMLGSQRIGPDLSNFGHSVYTNSIYSRLYDPRLIMASSVMPSYRFLFETRKVGFFPSHDALVLPDWAQPPAGYEVVPTAQARALAAYLMSLRQDGYLFEAPPPSSLKTNAMPTNSVKGASKIPVK
jgi:cytochrome c oxidase cbb3-type subunit 2